MDNIDFYSRKFNELQGQKSSIEKLLSSEKERNNKYIKDLKDALLASEVIFHVGKQTQEGLSVKIEKTTTTALQYVLNDPYTFHVDWDVSNNRTQCNLKFKKDGFEYNPLKDSGGTASDIASIALRTAVWALPEERTSPVFVLDENFKHVSKGMREKASEFLKHLCDSLGLQVITATHTQNTIDSCDKLFRIKRENGQSIIEEEVLG